MGWRDNSGAAVSVIKSFKPIAAKDARFLILGSMPGQVSLSRQQYYAHPRNQFWAIICGVMGIDLNTSYPFRRQQLIAHQIALWDVMKSCRRVGSLDSQINETSITANDIEALLNQCCHISLICFNGAKAEATYKRHVMPQLPASMAALPVVRLPSTSPAYAAMPFAQKMQSWKQALQCD